MSNPQTLHHGFSYQHVYSFWELLCLLEPETSYEHGRVEDHEAEHVDDVTLYPRTGSAAPARFIQVKWHVDLRACYSFASLCKVPPKAATSLLQKFYKSWQTLGNQGNELELWLVSTWPADAELGKHIRNTRLDDALLQSSPRSNGGKELKRWAEHLQCTDEELRGFAGSLRFRLGLGDDLLALLFDGRMKAHGLRTGRRAMHEVDTLVREWVKEGPLDIDGERLRQDIAEHGLAAQAEEKPTVCLWIHGWARLEYDDPATRTLDWTSHFDRNTRRIATGETWETALLPELEAARAHCEQARAGLVDVRGLLPLTAALATGATLATTAGYVLRWEQRTEGRKRLWRSDATPSRLRWNTELLQDGTGRDSLVALGITGDPRGDVAGFLESDDGQKAGIGRVLLARPDTGAEEAALDRDEDAVALANEARKLLKQEREHHGADRIHLMVYGPAGFALFLGQRLNAIGTIVTYEQSKDGGYQPSVILNTR